MPALQHSRDGIDAAHYPRAGDGRCCRRRPPRRLPAVIEAAEAFGRAFPMMMTAPADSRGKVS